MTSPKLALLTFLLCFFTYGSCLPLTNTPTVHPDHKLEPLIKDYLDNSRFEELCDLKVKLEGMAPSDEVDLAQAIDFIQAGLDLMDHRCSTGPSQNSDLTLDQEEDAVFAKGHASPQIQFPDFEMTTENLGELCDDCMVSTSEGEEFLHSFDDTNKDSKSSMTLVSIGIVTVAALTLFLACCVKGCRGAKRKWTNRSTKIEDPDLESV